MRLPDFPSTSGAFAPPPLPLRAAGAGPAGGFGALMGSVRQEVHRFIESGSGAGLNALGGLSPQAAWRRAQQAMDTLPAASHTEAVPVEGASREEQRAFLDRIAPMAQRAAERLGVAPELVAAHAALESGWGQRPLKAADGRSTHNLFGIKAGGAWRGAATEALTTEYGGGEAQKTTQSFRHYDSLEQAFGDYASLLRNSPRYQDALRVGGDARAFAEGLVRGGYATDPAYADKLVAVARQIQGAP
ncbi:MAG: flagellar assembly peptidoglycan hydrolase FlgJ [Hydrogenophaga sp.]|uniref:flagellar assembly peptidoglycan hydrolase FlgJ n=1 Tax=Hydrogenophaga sp. TaxID=1904254 RepID=UPI0016B2FC0A|nr:flagellar assembly peptidoglycan hydrolase FlgJ [Hydrogenophaga sp.]NIM43345.1 flagellar assembly peptidoglycan hydrolase FlgJ [Hydrogenophaga sp.]NIN28414.1 flagellar assembly peptidoglycan hydrolase FlgJ [Hydrogenophaga sp.]NIN29233.1 flagellar assembly peptidoglycan hydrolase FlgJ [Hydrogenophaga sp.]NIN57548.1 flagellar assembly peptidoglycan hydrolase FlgJ [Hydrogenophaga sp.]NIO53843.1 flagellar assembly peptidoglycan hydrolase FlgJ [Hydrogenophaga sp.]